jgi:hypothetical protein
MAVARAAAAAFGGRPEVRRFYDKGDVNSIDILHCADRPMAGYKTYSSLGLYETPNMLDGSDVRAEIAGVAASGLTEFPNALATAAFYVQKNRWLCAPGVVFPGLISDYRLSSTLQHVLWVPPFPWEQLGSVTVRDDLTVHWLLAVPISEAERQLLLDRGFDEFEKLLVEQGVEYFDLERPSLA